MKRLVNKLITTFNRHITLVACLVGVVLIAGMISYLHAYDSTKKITAKATAVAVVTSTATWKMSAGDYTNNRWFSSGIKEIQDAKTDAESSAAASTWLEGVKTDPNLLVGAATYFLDKVVDKTTLIDSKGYATDKAVQLVTELQLAIGQAKIVTAEAPATGYNSGVEDSTVVAAEKPGITGNRKAVQVSLANGKTIWIMGRCGNPVTQGKPPVPPGETDESPPTPAPKITPTMTSTPTPKVTSTPAPKDPAKDPAPRGNAPVGGGKNQDPGPGTYIPPEAMITPPVTVRVNPTPPAPTTPTKKPTTVLVLSKSTPDPAPPPPPEVEAPSKEKPATGYAPPPGM